ncbi:MAG: amidohydrolase family protein [Gammaproteobacteria bacterium]
MPLEVRESWLSQVKEEVLNPHQKIIDPHHHFFAPGGAFPQYDLSNLWDDTDTHGVEKTVFIQCWEGYRDDGPEHLLCVGETQWVNGIAKAAQAQPSKAQIGAIIGTAELRMGAAVREVLEAHIEASPLFRGIRLAAAWDADENIMDMPGVEHAMLYDDEQFRAGFAVLDDMGLVFDAYNYHPQISSLTKLAKDFPNVQIVLDHLGTPLGVSGYAGRMDEIYAKWTGDVAELAKCPNVVMKLGGLAMPWNGFGYDDASRPPTSDELVADQGRYYHFAIQQFGPERSMFESNFPVDKCALSYTVLWNAFKKIAADYSTPEKDAMFYDTAKRVYRID